MLADVTRDRYRRRTQTPKTLNSTLCKPISDTRLLWTMHLRKTNQIVGTLKSMSVLLISTPDVPPYTADAAPPYDAKDYRKDKEFQDVDFEHNDNPNLASSSSLSATHHQRHDNVV